MVHNGRSRYFVDEHLQMHSIGHMNVIDMTSSRSRPVQDLLLTFSAKITTISLKSHYQQPLSKVIISLQ